MTRYLCLFALPVLTPLFSFAISNEKLPDPLPSLANRALKIALSTHTLLFYNNGKTK